MAKKPGEGFGLAAVCCGMVLCCAVLVLMASGALGAIVAWISGESFVWLITAVLALAAGGVLLRSRRRTDRREPSGDQFTGGAP